MIIAEVSHAGSRSFHARIRDISDGGIRIATQELLSAGTRLAVKLPRIGWVQARVAWQRQGLTGLAFREEIDSRWVFAGLPGAFMAA